MKIFRSILESPQGTFLVDAEHDGEKLGLLKIHPVIDGIVWASLPLCQLKNVRVLIDQLERMIPELP